MKENGWCRIEEGGQAYLDKNKFVLITKSFEWGGLKILSIKWD